MVQNKRIPSTRAKKGNPAKNRTTVPPRAHKNDDRERERARASDRANKRKQQQKKEASKTKNERSNIDVREALPINDTAPPHVVGIGGRRGGTPQGNPPPPFPVEGSGYIQSHALRSPRARCDGHQPKRIDIYCVYKRAHTHTHVRTYLGERKEEPICVIGNDDD